MNNCLGPNVSRHHVISVGVPACEGGVSSVVLQMGTSVWMILTVLPEDSVNDSSTKPQEVLAAVSSVRPVCQPQTWGTSATSNIFTPEREKRTAAERDGESKAVNVKNKMRGTTCSNRLVAKAEITCLDPSHNVYSIPT
ncbi:unnamed protein product [Leuciscus chuanchicus]